MTKQRCPWANHSQLEMDYHDNEWGIPTHDDHKHFELITLEGAQAGLSWSLILKKRHHYRRLFDNFNPNLIVAYNENKLISLLNNPGIIRNKSKINAVVNNAQRFLEVQEKYGSFDQFIWSYVGGEPIVNKWQNAQQVPSFTPLSEQLSNDLKKLGFKFVGPTILYSYLQASGLINDHLVGCSFKHTSK